MNFPKEFFKHGNFTMAYSLIVDDNMRLFDSDYGQIGYFDSKKGRLFVGDPMCDKNDLEKIVKDFLKDSSKKKVIGLQCGVDTGNTFYNEGYNATRMGVETILDVKSFDYKGKKKAKVRRWLNAAKSLNVCEGDFNKNYDDLKQISDEWLKTKGNDELNILLRPFPKEDTNYTRVFLSKIEDKTNGFVIFDPMFEDSQLIGYYANLCRFNNNSTNGAFDLIISNALDKFKSENVKYLSFGLSPLAEVVPTKTDNYFVRNIAKLNFDYGESMYAFKGIDFHKKAYHDDKQSFRRPVYFVTKGTLPLFDITNTFSTIGIIPKNNLLYPIINLAKGVYNEKFK
jgi:lysylphosphatidylglycerol synthetase-like protein (DUF2156 family)